MTTPKSRAESKPHDPLVEFCRGLPGATEDVKWGNDLIFSVGDKMFAGFPLDGGDPIGFKVDPLLFASLVGHNGVVAAPYMARHSWVHVTDRSLLPIETIQDLLAASHQAVAAGLSRKKRAALGIVDS